MHFHDNRYTYRWVQCSVYGPPGECKRGAFRELGGVENWLHMREDWFHTGEELVSKEINQPATVEEKMLVVREENGMSLRQ